MEIGIKIISDGRDGILKDLGQVINDHGYKLLRNRITSADAGISLALHVQGNAARVLDLEDALASHPRVIDFESEHDISSPTASLDIPSRGAAPSKSRAASERTDREQQQSAFAYVETQLPGLARIYPRIFPRLISILGKLPLEQRGAGMKFAGRRVGAWVYKRDYAFGGNLDFHGVMTRIAQPAISELLAVDLVDNELHLDGSPLCNRTSNGDFFCGMIEGLLAEAGVGSGSMVRETGCRSEGHKHCIFEVLPG